jgi:hypothetical protein
LSDFSIPNPAFEKEYQNRIGARKRELSRELTTVEHLEIRTALYAEMPVVLGHCPRVTLFENPFARRTLPQGVFEGPYDARHRFNLKLGMIERVFGGKGLVDAEQLSQNGRDIAQKIEAFQQAVTEHFAPERIVLFGSHAYVDLLVIFPGNGSAADRSLEIRKKLIPDFPLDLITRSTGEIEDRLKLGDSFLREILSHGKTLYESAHT